MRNPLNLSIFFVIFGLILGLISVSIISPVQAAHDYSGLQIKAQDSITPVTSITFPRGVPGDYVLEPSNNEDGTGSPQTLGESSSKPVIRLVNTSSDNYTVWINISSFTNYVVDSEYFLLVDYGEVCANAGAISKLVSWNTDVDTTKIIGPADAGGTGDQKDLYLKIQLNNIAASSGTSTITILGELSP